MDKKRIREPVVEGIFYPDKKKELEREINQLLEKSPEKEGNKGAIIVPHAGYTYCGSLLASAFKSVARTKPSLAVCMGPVHGESEPGIFLTESEAFRTPLGELPVDMESVETFLECGTKISKNDLYHMEEHSLEIMLPFIQVVFGEIKILPILTGGFSSSLIKTLSNALRLVFSENAESVLFIATSNLSRLSRAPEAKQESETYLELIKNMDTGGLIKAYEEKSIRPCGIIPVTALLSFLPEKTKIKLIGIKESRETLMDKEKTIVYGAMNCFNGKQ